MKPLEIRLLSQKDIIQLELQPEDVIGAVEQALTEHSNGTCEMHPKIGVHPTGTDPDNFFHGMPAYLKQLGACGVKWVGGFAKNPQQDLPNVTGIQICYDGGYGRAAGYDGLRLSHGTENRSGEHRNRPPLCHA